MLKLWMSALLLLTSCLPVSNSFAEPAKAVPLEKGMVADQDYACFDNYNMTILAGQVSVCEACQNQLTERDNIIQRMMEQSEAQWYRNPWIWFAVGVSIGLGGAVAISVNQ